MSDLKKEIIKLYKSVAYIMIEMHHSDQDKIVMNEIEEIRLKIIDLLKEFEK